jgi:hypothetical protein
LQPSRPKKLARIIDEWGSVLEAAQRIALQVVGMISLIYLVIRAILK